MRKTLPPADEAGELPWHVRHVRIVEPQFEFLHADVTLQEPSLVLPVVEVRPVAVTVERIQFHFADCRHRE